MFLGWGNAGIWAVTLYVGEEPRGSNGARVTLLLISIFHSATHNQTGPLWCCFPSGWACARPRPLWVSPRTSPVRLGVSPAATPPTTGIFNQRFAWVAWSASFPAVCPVYLCASMGPRGVTRRSACPVLHHSESGLSVYLCANVGPQDLLVVRLRALFVPHSASLGPSHSHGSPLHPGARLRSSYRSG